MWRNVVMEQIPVVSGAMKNDLPHAVLPQMPDEISTRELSGVYLDSLLGAGADIVGGSADLGGSTNVHVSASRDIMTNDTNAIINYVLYFVKEFLCLKNY